MADAWASCWVEVLDLPTLLWFFCSHSGIALVSVLLKPVCEHYHNKTTLIIKLKCRRASSTDGAAGSKIGGQRAPDDAQAHNCHIAGQ